MVVALTKAVVVYTVFTMHHINSLGANTMFHSPRIHTHTHLYHTQTLTEYTTERRRRRVEVDVIIRLPWSYTEQQRFHFVRCA